MDLTKQILNYIMNRQLGEDEIKRMLNILTTQGREDFMGKIAAILGKVTALLAASNTVSDTLSLEIILNRVIDITTDAVKADRGTLFLNDEESGELYTRIADADEFKDIRFPNNDGIAGDVFTKGEAVIIDDAYADPRFNPAIDKSTGYKTRNMLCAPIVNRDQQVIGVTQLLNKEEGDFTTDDLEVLEAITSQVSAALINAQLFEQVQKAREQESQLLELTTAISSELQLEPLLQLILETTSTILSAERSTLFLHDKKTDELYSKVAQGVEDMEIRFTSRAGLAGRAFTRCETVNVEDAYRDLSFARRWDRQTGYRTKSVLCMPVFSKTGEPIGVMQVLNKRNGNFDSVDERKLKGFTSQAAIAIENAMLFEEVLNIKNYNESILQSMANGVVTLNADNEIEKCNAAALKIFGLPEEQILNMSATELFTDDNQWVNEVIERVLKTGAADLGMDTELHIGDQKMSVNLNTVPLHDVKNEHIGTMLVIEDITSEKRLHGTLTRYMTKEVADKLMEAEDSDNALGGQLQVATVLFSDIRGFTPMSERLGAQETVRMLNEYFTMSVDIIFEQHGILDKYIGDAILAVFGTPFSTGEDEDNAVKAAVGILRALHKFNTRRKAENQDTIDIGLGINTDEILVGNIGSEKRMDYTVIGDGVNLAARLEGANKYYHTSLLVSELTYNNLKGDYRAVEVDQIRVKGKERPVSVYEILDYYQGDAAAKLDAVVSLHNEGLKLYRAQSWAESRDVYRELHSICPQFGLAEVYIDRCQHFQEEPPEDDWDGVWTLTQK